MLRNLWYLYPSKLAEPKADMDVTLQTIREVTNSKSDCPAQSSCCMASFSFIAKPSAAELPIS